MRSITKKLGAMVRCAMRKEYIELSVLIRQERNRDHLRDTLSNVDEGVKTYG
jgi:hypothetical protein